ncbi:MAG: hypothetical protein WCH93_00385, partial [Actinomycetota bacterium]
MVLPGLSPICNRSVGELEVLLNRRDISEDGVDGIQDFLSRAVGFAEGVRRDPRFACGIVVITDFKKQLRIAAAPRVDRLLGIPDIEERAGSSGILDDLINKRGEDVPLRAAGILKLVEHPVVVPGVEPVADCRAPCRIIHAGREKIGDVGKRQASMAAGQRVVGRLEPAHHGMEGGAAAQEALVFRLHQRAQESGSGFGYLGVQVNPRRIGSACREIF